MNDFNAFGSVSSDAGSEYAARGLMIFPQPSGALPVMTARHRVPAAHAAWAVDVIAPQRKRRTAAVATDASVDRGFL